MDTIERFMGGRIVVALGSITEFRGDALVNAANSTLLGGGGVDGAIHAAAGPALLSECRSLRSRELPEGLPTGRAAATGAGRLGVKAVIHTVGPVWLGGARGEPELLESCYRESLSLARDRGYTTVAFPAVSTGVYGYPKAEAARVAYRTISRFLEENPVPEEVTLVFYSKPDAEVFLASV